MTDTELKPFQCVLVRDENDEFWKAHIFGYKTHDGFFCCIGGGYWKYCIPYEGNENLLNTTQSPTPPEPTFQMGDHVEVRDVGENSPWLPAVFLWDSDDTYVVIRKGEQQYTNWFHCRHADW